jgi:hypothetical protein
MEADSKKKIGSGLETANIFSKLYFLWVLPKFVKGFLNNLTINDVYDLPPKNISQVEEEKLEK